MPLFEETRRPDEAKLGPDHPDTLTSCTTSRRLLDDEATRQVRPSVRRGAQAARAKLGRQHPDTLATVANLGVNYKDAGRLKEAIPLLEEAYQAAKTIPQLRWVDGQLIDAYVKAGENAKLADLLQEQLAEARKTLPKDSPQLAGMLAQTRSEPPATEEMDRGRTAPPRVPGHPREDAARCLVHLQHEVDARRRSAGPEEIRRGRTALAEAATRG